MWRYFLFDFFASDYMILSIVIPHCSIWHGLIVQMRVPPMGQIEQFNHSLKIIGYLKLRHGVQIVGNQKEYMINIITSIK